MINASCHCGNVEIQTANLPASVTSCNCSVCNRIGALWAYYPTDAVRIYCHKESTASYSWDKQEIEFHHCPNCGCITHYETTRKSNKQCIAINFRMTDLDILESVPVRKFDGADSWQYIDANISIHEATYS